MSSSSSSRFLDPESLRDAALRVASIATRQRVPVLLIGGYAMQFYGSDRLTGDVDFAASAMLRGLPAGEPLSFGGKQTLAPNAVPLDLVIRNDDFAPLYEAAILKPRHHRSLPGVPIVRAEFLAAMKMVAGRPKDNADLDSLVLSGNLNIPAARKVIAKFLGPYAAQEFDQTVEVAEWQRSRGRR